MESDRRHAHFACGQVDVLGVWKRNFSTNYSAFSPSTSLAHRIVKKTTRTISPFSNSMHTTAMWTMQ